MNIVVLVKQVPDTSAERRLNPADNTLDRASVDAVINEIDEFARGGSAAQGGARR